MRLRFSIVSCTPRVCLVITALALLVAAIPLDTAVAQTQLIVLDGQFADWLGQPNVADPQGDSQTDHTDIAAFYFANNLNQSMLYFMAQRWDVGSESMVLQLRIDTNNNVLYTEGVDRLIVINYNPNPYGNTDVDLYDGSGAYLSQIAADAYWGEPDKGSSVEWGVSFTDLGIVAYQTIRIQLFSYQGNQLSDAVSEVQWSPANALGWYLLIPLGLGGIAWLYYQRRRKL